MKYQDTGEKFLPSGKQPDMNDMSINHQITDLMRGRKWWQYQRQRTALRFSER